MTEDQAAERVAAALTGKFYVGQRVRFAHGNLDPVYGNGDGVIEYFDTVARDRAARITFDSGFNGLIFLWALRPL